MLIIACNVYFIQTQQSFVCGGAITIQATVYDTYFIYDQCVRYQALYMS